MVIHSQTEMLRQRIYQIMAGSEDANDCDRLCGDGILKMYAGRSASDEIALAEWKVRWVGEWKDYDLDSSVWTDEPDIFYNSIFWTDKHNVIWLNAVKFNRTKRTWVFGCKRLSLKFQPEILTSIEKE